MAVAPQVLGGWLLGAFSNECCYALARVLPRPTHRNARLRGNILFALVCVFIAVAAGKAERNEHSWVGTRRSEYVRVLRDIYTQDSTNVDQPRSGSRKGQKQDSFVKLLRLLTVLRR